MIHIPVDLLVGLLYIIEISVEGGEYVSVVLCIFLCTLEVEYWVYDIFVWTIEKIINCCRHT